MRRIFLVCVTGFLVFTVAMTSAPAAPVVAGHAQAGLAKKTCTIKKVHGKKKKVCKTVKPMPTPTPAATPAPLSPPIYTLIDVGTLGGSASWFSSPSQVITSDGTVLGGADTTVADPDFKNKSNFFDPTDPNVTHAALWRKGVLTDLGALPGNNSSAIFELNASGEGAGVSENGAVNSVTNVSEARAVVWKDGQIIDLGTLGGQDSFAAWINDQGQVVGMTTNAVQDPVTLDTWPTVGTQMRAFLWQNGHLQDLGTLGGPDSAADYVNSHGQVAGNSFVNATVNPATEIPTEHPFLWQNGHMHDLGSLGGTRAFPTAGGYALNDRGEVVGVSTLTGDPVDSNGVLKNHPFLWDGTAMKDLGTIGGNHGVPYALNQAGDVVGGATTNPSDSNAHAFLWKDGVLTDLDGIASSHCHSALSINASDQIVGGACGSEVDGWLWDHGKLSDLNTLIAPPASHLVVGAAHYITDQGEIAAVGILPNGDHHMVLLVPIAPAQREGLRSVTRSQS
jgi:probable HAF family extracellular repeat protein